MEGIEELSKMLGSLMNNGSTVTIGQVVGSQVNNFYIGNKENSAKAHMGITPQESQGESSEPTDDIEKAVSEFMDKLHLLLDTVHSKWNGKTVSGGGRNPQIEIIMDKEKLGKYLQENMSELTPCCYPVSKQTLRNQCKFLATLHNKGIFGKLPKNLLAQEWAIITHTSEGSIKRYLSLK